MSEKWPEWLSQNKEWLVQFSPTLSIQSIESIAKRGFRGGTAAILHYLYELWWPGQKWDNGEITANGLWMAVSLAHEKELETATAAERERITGIYLKEARRYRGKAQSGSPDEVGKCSHTANVMENITYDIREGRQRPKGRHR